MHTETVTYQADNLTFRSEFYLNDPGGLRRPGVLIFPEAYGLGDHVRSRAQRLTAMGFVALACDLHGEATLYTDLGEAVGKLAPMHQDPLKTRARAQGALNALLARPEVDPARIGAIGFCFGGTMALELARSGAPLAAVVGFHSGLATARPQDAHQIRARVLVCIGADDPFIPQDQRLAFQDEMRTGNVDWQMHLYGGVVHSFTNEQAARANRPEAVRYSATADQRSWASLRELFQEAFA